MDVPAARARGDAIDEVARETPGAVHEVENIRMAALIRTLDRKTLDTTKEVA